jgi:hypothetical protein
LDIVINSGYVCASSSRFEKLREAQMSLRWFQVRLVRPIQLVLRWKWARPTAVVLAVLLVLPVFLLRRKDGSVAFSERLAHGSLLIMSGDTQKNYRYEVPKEPGITLPRINLTFRRMDHK